MRLAERCAQVALTYTQPLALRLWATGAAIAAMWVLSIRDARYGEQIGVLMLGGTFASLAGTLVAAHAKEQLADWRARLNPGFRLPHLLVAAAIFVATVIGMTLFTTLAFARIPYEVGWPIIKVWTPGFATLVLVAAASLAWITHMSSPKLIFGMLALFSVVVTTRTGQNLVAGVIIGEEPAIGAALLAGAVAALAALGWRLGTMHEEMPEYFRLDSFGTSLRIAMTGDRFFRRAAASETGALNEFVRGAKRIDRVRNIFNAPWWRRMLHWRLVIGYGRTGMIAALSLIPLLLACYFFGGRYRRDMEVGLFILLPTVLSLTVPITLTAVTWPQRWFMLAGESLRPARSRGRFFREQGAAMAWELASVWLWLTACAFFNTLLLRPAWVLTVQAACTLLISAAAQVFLFAVSVWILRLRMGWFMNYGVLVLSVMYVGYVGRQFEGHGQTGLRTPSPLWAAWLAGLGVLITLDAYRRWLKTDLD